MNHLIVFLYRDNKTKLVPAFYLFFFLELTFGLQSILTVVIPLETKLIKLFCLHCSHSETVEKLS